MLKKLRYRFKILNKLNQFSFGVRKYFFIILSINFISLAISLIIPTLYKIFIDQVIIERNIKSFIFILLGYLGFFVINTLLSFLRNYSSNRLLNRVLFRVKHRILCNYLELPFEEYKKRSTSDLKMRIDDDILKLSDFGGVQTVDYLKSLVTALASGILILLIEWRLALFSIVVIPLTFYLDHKISLKEKELININRGNDQRWNSWLYDSIQGWKEVKALNLQRKQLRTFARYAHNFAEFFGRWINYWVLRILIIPKIKDEFLMKFALYFFGGLLIMRGEISIGTLLVFAMYYDLLSDNIRLVSSTDAELQSNMPYYDRVMDEINIIKNNTVRYFLPKSSNTHISMENISFSYNESLPFVIKEFSLDIKKGERVAITGPSGSGKTTILKLMTRMLKPDYGQILFSDIDINKINPNYLYSKIGIILQENLLFNISIYENLKLACPDADINMLDEACKKACIYDFIHTQPKGYDTIIGERGVKLSGGQRQRLVLARLFLRDVDVMIFDEATSAIDQYSESIIHDAINAVGEDKTIIIIAHRESSIALCDRVINLVKG